MYSRMSKLLALSESNAVKLDLKWISNINVKMFLKPHVASEYSTWLVWIYDKKKSTFMMVKENH